jgi:hypothetical protein
MYFYSHAFINSEIITLLNNFPFINIVEVNHVARKYWVLSTIMCGATSVIPSTQTSTGSTMRPKFCSHSLKASTSAAAKTLLISMVHPCRVKGYMSMPN